MPNFTKLVIVPHNRGSRSLRDLAGVLGNKLGYKVWRVSPQRIGRRIPFVFRGGKDKLTQLTAFKEAGIPCPEFTTDRSQANEWLNEGHTVVCRHLLNASEGRGIQLISPGEELPNAPLYTKYFKKRNEYRVHVFNGEVIDVQEKRRRTGFQEERDTRIRNTSNGYVFCRDFLNPPSDLNDVAIRATNALGYFLGAVDIVYNQHYNLLAVLEVNAAPGLTGTTLENYSNNIIEWYKEQLG